MFLGENEKLHKEDSNGNEENNIDNDCEKDVKITSKPGESLLFVYQAKWLKHLLPKYGNELSLLDATYKKTRSALPLFFLVVKTNVNYHIVATFVTESQSVERVAEALQAIKQWNPTYKPRYFMTDYSKEEITALEDVLLGNLFMLHNESNVYIKILTQNEAIPYWVKIVFHFIVPSIS